jgi:superfamily I DNA/RNA helicase
MFHGTVPIYKVFDTKGKEVNHIIGKISGIIENGSHVKLSDVVIATRTKDSYREIITKLHNEGIEYFDLRDQTGNRNGVHFCTFHSLKGLEYKVVILADVNELTCPYLPYKFEDWSKEEQETHLNSEKSLLYTAMTRAIMELYVTGVGGETGLIS